MRLGIFVAAAIGFAIAAYLVLHVGAAPVFAAVRAVGVGGFALICAYALGLIVVLAAGWYALFAAGARPHLTDFLIARQVRDSASDVLPLNLHRSTRAYTARYRNAHCFRVGRGRRHDGARGADRLHRDRNFSLRGATARRPFNRRSCVRDLDGNCPHDSGNCALHRAAAPRQQAGGDRGRTLAAKCSPACGGLQ